MSTLLYNKLPIFDKASIETDKKKVSIIICQIDKKSATYSITFEKDFSIALFFLVLLPIGFLFLLPFFIFYFTIIFPIKQVIAKFIKPKPEPSYEEACRWFEQNKGDYQNLSAKERKKRLAQYPDLPLGL